MLNDKMKLKKFTQNTINKLEKLINKIIIVNNAEIGFESPLWFL